MRLEFVFADERSNQDFYISFLFDLEFWSQMTSCSNLWLKKEKGFGIEVQVIKNCDRESEKNRIAAQSKNIKYISYILSILSSKKAL